MKRVYPAHKVTPFLVQDPELMALWKEAAQEGRLRAETRSKENVVIVEDPAIIGRLEALGLTGQKE